MPRPSDRRRRLITTIEPIESNICLVKPKTDESRRVVPTPQQHRRATPTPLREYARATTVPRTSATTDSSGPTRTAHHLDDRKDYWAWRAVLEDAGIEKLALHGARNTPPPSSCETASTRGRPRDPRTLRHRSPPSRYQRADLDNGLEQP